MGRPASILASLAAATVILAAAVSGCVTTQTSVKESPVVSKLTADRADRRLYDGAPPIIPHEEDTDCLVCHRLGSKAEGDDDDVPIAPHSALMGIGANARCVQCHVHQKTTQEFAANAYHGQRQDMRRGDRYFDSAPPRLPHSLQMRKDCLACHSGEAARAEIKTPHPERARCLQCHVPVFAEGEFSRAQP